MKLKRGILELGHEDEMPFKNKMSTLLCVDGIVYIMNDDILQESAEKIDKLPPVKAKAMASTLFGNAHSARVGRKGKIYVKDAPAAMTFLDGEFEVIIIDKGLCALLPEGKSRENIEFFKHKLTNL